VIQRLEEKAVSKRRKVRETDERGGENEIKKGGLAKMI
jgi:hypothetical protein